MSDTPFVVGQWVRGQKFYGREALLSEILHGHRNSLWLLGTRRIGKTSLLKHVEHLTCTSPEHGYFPLFWDFQGAENPKELHLSLGDALLDAQERLEAGGLSLAQVQADDLFQSLSLLRRALRARKTRLLLLCDEVEELIKLRQQDPSLLRKLRRAMQSQEDMRSVLASTIRLWALSDQRGDTSPFLHGFMPPLYIHNLVDDEARALIQQANLPDVSRPRFDTATVEAIRSHCDNHPYLIQLLCKRFLELERLDDAIEQVAGDPMVSFFFAVDFEMLAPEERAIVRVVAEHDSATSNSIQVALPMESPNLAANLHRLEHLGYVRKNEQRQFQLANYFFRAWFRNRPAVEPSPSLAEQQTLALMEDSTLTGPGTPRVLDGRYHLLERIGGGAMGTVYKAEDTLLRTTIAIKLLRSEYATNDEALARLRREILLGRDIAHPNVVRIYHLGECAGRKYITMQWMEGPTLAKLIAAEAPFAAARLLRIGGKLAAALGAAHACRVLHRDIKPSNILMGESDEPYVADFGLARLLGDAGATSGGVFIGTPDYASPEQARLLPLDERSDIYSLGVVLFEMATGRRPFVAGSARDVLELHRTAGAPDPRALCPPLPPTVSSLILRCLEKEPDRRFQSAAELALALGHAAAR